MRRDQEPSALSDRLLRRIDRFLDEADEALGRKDWTLVRENAQAVLALDPANPDAQALLAASGRATEEVPRFHKA